MKGATEKEGGGGCDESKCWLLMLLQSLRRDRVVLDATSRHGRWIMRHTLSNACPDDTSKST